MRRNLLIACGVTMSLLLGITPAQAVTQDFRNVYDVQSGDTLWKIAGKYGTSVQSLKTTNGLQSDLILTGQQLWVPTTYQVVDGDSLWKISATYNSTVQLIKAANGLSSDVIYPGQILKVPQQPLTMQGQYVLMTREQFKDWLFHNEFTRQVSLIQEHHTESPSYKDFNGSNYFTLLKGIEDYHVKVKGWSNISQNLTTFPDGKVAVCRPLNTAPEGSWGIQNPAVGRAIEAGSLAIENLGDFDVSHDTMTQQQKDTLVYVTALLCLKFGLTPSIDSITYHHWWDMNTGQRVLDNSAGHFVKSCPGTAFFGGNTTESAKANFYPLVIQQMQAIRKTLQ